ncbi:M23 family metallopeptidase [Sphingopyxis flava]|uniref:Murein DD-endopeptidase MepM and murein hydrolase activator NlpD, contain LysM domain n=1 Tax=Sphingopyxis flava TaxID=1507287 RepID=A0A1T5FJ71_9SPHN|nr:M23 family metallopeptidase [Sphingopyxis flava]SKB96221.1 Murein DD-endopeptidase MepM and murein hydrolase activator NlpD, contain LysM domain [Sphingopyxis flava]
MTAFAARSMLVLVAAIAAVPSAAEEPGPSIAHPSSSVSASGGAGLIQSHAVTGSPAALANGLADAASGAAPARAVIRIGPEGVAAGAPRFAVRSNFADTALLVSFSSSPPRAAVSGGPLPSLLPAGGRLTSSFGWRGDPMHGATRFHSGIDLAAPAGSPIRATQAGSVTRAGWAGNYGYMVTLDHGNGVETRYAHMSAINVEAGRTVNQGDIIGLVGSTGRSTGPHVHYEVRVGGRATNPLGR